jgi:hypothetical protein
MKSSLLTFFISYICFFNLTGQKLPAPEENIPFLVTYGKDAPISTGDNDHIQEVFFLVPLDHMGPFFLRIYDPWVGGDNDFITDDSETCTEFSVYGGNGVFEPGNHSSGIRLQEATFCDKNKKPDEWHTFGPFTPDQGQLSEKLNATIFKVIAKGLSGKNGNQYYYVLSQRSDENKPIEMARFHYWEITFSLWNNPNNASHIYPEICGPMKSMQVRLFDWDGEGMVRLVTVLRNGDYLDIPGDAEWTENLIQLQEEEYNTSLDLQVLRDQTDSVKSKTVTIQLLDEKGEPLHPCGKPFFYKYKIE